MHSLNSINKPLIINENIDGEQSIEPIVPGEVSILTLGGEEFKCKINTSIASLIRSNGLCEHGGTLSFAKDYNGKFLAYLSNALAPIENEEEDNPVAIGDDGPNLDGLVDSNGMLKGFVTLGHLSELYEKEYGDVDPQSQANEEDGKSIYIPFNTTQSLDEALREIENDYNNDLAKFRKERLGLLSRGFCVGSFSGGLFSMLVVVFGVQNDESSDAKDQFYDLVLFFCHVLTLSVCIHPFLSVVSGFFAELAAWTNNNFGEPCLSTKKLRSRTDFEQAARQSCFDCFYLNPRDWSDNSCAATFRAYGEIARAKDKFNQLRSGSVVPYANEMER